MGEGKGESGGFIYCVFVIWGEGVGGVICMHDLTKAYVFLVLLCGNLICN